MSKSVSEMTTAELGEYIVRFKKAANTDKLVRAEYIRRIGEGEEGDDRIEVCAGRNSQKWIDTDAVLEALAEIAEANSDLVNINNFVQPISVGRVLDGLEWLEIEPSLALIENIEEKKGEPFARLKPQSDPEQFRD